MYQFKWRYLDKIILLHQKIPICIHMEFHAVMLKLNDSVLKMDHIFSLKRTGKELFFYQCFCNSFGHQMKNRDLTYTSKICETRKYLLVSSGQRSDIHLSLLTMSPWKRFFFKWTRTCLRLIIFCTLLWYLTSWYACSKTFIIAFYE